MMMMFTTRSFVCCLALLSLISTLARGQIEVERFRTNPLISQENGQNPGRTYWSVNFPTVIRVPDWVDNPLGRYYMYFSSHHGTYISLAYSDKPEGPWTVYAPAVLTLEQVFKVNGEVYNISNLDESAECATADIYLDNSINHMVMYFHARLPSDNYAIVTRVAFSHDGLFFEPIPGYIGSAYMRHFTWGGDDYVYLLDRSVTLLRSRTGWTDLEMGNGLIGAAFTQTSQLGANGPLSGLVRHVGVSVAGHYLYVFGSVVGDAPERILYTVVDLQCLITNWTACAPLFPAVDAFQSEYWYEGVEEPIEPSLKGNKGVRNGPVHELRDPFPFVDNGNCYIYYGAAGNWFIAGGIMNPRFCFPRTAEYPAGYTILPSSQVVGFF